MLDQSVLFQAKVFLCWDRFPDLEIKLIPIQTTVAFFYPPHIKFPIIHLYYQPGTNNLIEPLCFLFHEVGHYLQWEKKAKSGKQVEFFDLIDRDRGEEKIRFERQAWDYGSEYLNLFLEQGKIAKDQVIEKYENLKKVSLKTYSDRIDK